MDFPLRCSRCEHENWVDLDAPLRWRLNDVVTIEGFLCQYCEEHFAFFYTTQSMTDLLFKLERISPEKAVFQWTLSKAHKKALGIRSKYGQSFYGN